MTKDEAIRQLCKIQEEVADRLGIETRCLCDDAKEKPENLMMVPDEVISELWALVADGYLFRLIRDICKVDRPKGRRIGRAARRRVVLELPSTPSRGSETPSH